MQDTDSNIRVEFVIHVKESKTKYSMIFLPFARLRSGIMKTHGKISGTAQVNGLKETNERANKVPFDLRNTVKEAPTNEKVFLLLCGNRPAWD